jgi:hypothetical protein
MIEIGRRRFITGLAALVAAPAVIRIAPLMPISSRFVPCYVPVVWLSGLAESFNRTKEIYAAQLLGDLKNHGWPRPLEDSWININDYDPAFAADWIRRIERERHHGPWA